MKLLSILKIPFSEDKVFGFLLLSLIVVSMVSITVFSEPFEFPRLLIWSVLLGLSLLFALKTNQLHSSLPKPLILVMCFIWIWALFGTIFSLDRINSLIGVNIRMTSSLWFYSLWLVTIYLLSTLDKARLAVLLKVWFILGGLISIWAVLQFFGVGFYEGLDAPVRTLVPSFLANPNFSAMYIASTIFISMWYLSSKQFTTRFRILAFSILGFNIIALVIFASRGAIIGVIGGLLILGVIYLLRKKWRVVFSSILLILVLSGISYVYLNSAREQSVVSAGKDLSAQQRWYLWDDAMINIIKYPLTGTGLANYFIQFRQSDASYFSNSQWFDDAHNIFLHLAVNGGIASAIAFIILLYYTAWNLYKNYKITYDNFPLYLLAALISWSISASFNPVIIANWFLLALIIVFSIQYLPLRNIHFSNLSKKIGYLISVIFIIGGSALLLSEVGLWISDTYLTRNKNFSIELNKIATYINPTSPAAISSLAKKQFDDNQFDESYQTFRRLEKLHPQSAYITEGALAGYLDLYTATNDVKYKEDVYRTIPIVLKYFPNNQSTRYNVASFYLKLGDYDNALKQIRTAIVYSYGDYGSWIMMSDIFEQMGQLDNKKKALRSAYKVYPTASVRNYINE